MDLQQAVTRYTESNNTTKDRLAEKVGIGRTAFYMKLRGTSKLTLEEAYRLSRELGCTVDDICDLAGVPKIPSH